MNEHEQEDALSRALHHRSQDIGNEHPIALDEVRGRARRIRARRRVAGAAVAAAALAVVVPTSVLLAPAADHGTGPVAQPAPTVASPTTSTSPSPSTLASSSPSASSPASASSSASALLPGVTALTTTGLTRGKDPTVAYLHGRTLMRPDGGTVTLPGVYAAITPYRGGYLASPRHSADQQVVTLDNALHVASTRPGSSALAISGDLMEASYFLASPSGGPGELVSGISNGMADTESKQPVPAGVSATPVGYTGAGSVLYTTDGVSPHAYVTDFGNTGPREVPGMLKATGANEQRGLISGLTRANPDGSGCFSVLRAASMSPLWQTCDFSLGRFSVDGKYVAAGPSYLDGLGSASVAILDAGTGTPVARFQRPASSDLLVANTAWQDDDHLLALVHESGAWSILRLSVDGHVEAATDPVPGSADQPAFAFAATP
ncbi:MAG: hypothetical protein ACXVEV_16020 [Nocardioidaceae bacterium]